MDTRVVDDESLVRAVQAGDGEAFAELFRRHYPSVRRVCARRLAGSGEADEVAQAAFVRAYERIQQCAGQRHFGPWVQVIASRLCADGWRARARTVPVEDPMTAAEAAPGPDDCEEALLRDERAAEVQHALATLPSRQRQVLVARHLDEQRPVEIAAALGLSVGAVDSLLLRARRRMATAYRAASAEHGGVSTSVGAASVGAGSAVANAGPLLRAAGVVARVAQAGGSWVAEVVGLAPSAPAMAERVAALAAAGTLLLAQVAGAPAPSPLPVAVPAPAADVGAVVPSTTPATALPAPPAVAPPPAGGDLAATPPVPPSLPPAAAVSPPPEPPPARATMPSPGAGVDEAVAQVLGAVADAGAAVLGGAAPPLPAPLP